MKGKKLAVALLLGSVAQAVCGGSEESGSGPAEPDTGATGLSGLQATLAADGIGALAPRAFIGCTGAEAWRRKMPCRRGSID